MGLYDSNKLIVSQLVQKAIRLNETDRNRMLEDAIKQGIIDETGAATLNETLRVLNGKKLGREEERVDK